MNGIRKGARKLRSLLHATIFAVVAVGGLSSGLGLATYTVSKANELVFGPVAATPLDGGPEQCRS